jgi:predicted ATPase
VLHDCAWLVRLLPELLHVVHAPVPAWTLPPEQERRLMFAAVGRFLAHVAGPARTLLVLDDLQWAGADALELLSSLLQAPARPLRVLGAYRSTEVDAQSPLAVALADLAHAGLAAHLTLGPLKEADAECLLDALLREVGPVDARLRAQLLQRAGGVPFFAVSCVRALRPGAQAAGALPWDLRHSIRQRVAALTQEVQEVLGAAAVLGRRVAPGLLTAVAARPEEAVLAALEAATRAQLLVEEADAAAYQFTHDVIREHGEGCGDADPASWDSPFCPYALVRLGHTLCTRPSQPQMDDHPASGAGRTQVLGPRLDQRRQIQGSTSTIACDANCAAWKCNEPRGMHGSSYRRDWIWILGT